MVNYNFKYASYSLVRFPINSQLISINICFVNALLNPGNPHLGRQVSSLALNVRGLTVVAGERRNFPPPKPALSSLSAPLLSY